MRGCLLSYSQAKPGRELTQPSRRLFAEPCNMLSPWPNLLYSCTPRTLLYSLYCILTTQLGVFLDITLNKGFSHVNLAEVQWGVSPLQYINFHAVSTTSEGIHFALWAFVYFVWQATADTLLFMEPVLLHNNPYVWVVTTESNPFFTIILTSFPWFYP